MLSLRRHAKDPRQMTLTFGPLDPLAVARMAFVPAFENWGGIYTSLHADQAPVH